MTNHTNSSKAASQQVSKKQNSLIWVSLLIGLIGLVGLIYHQGTIPAQADGTQLAGPARNTLAVPLNSVQVQAPITPLDVVVLFDVSGSAEDQTSCHDCWVRTSYNITSTPYPNNGYFNPMPYDPNLAPGAANQSIPLSRLCTDPATPWQQTNGAASYKYLTLEAELYSANIGNWDLTVRTPGQGFWAIQRGSLGTILPPGIDSAENSSNQGNQAGRPDYQSSNVCNPALPGGINCTINTNDNVCTDEPGIPNTSDIIRDCSAYIAARPYQTYSQPPGNLPSLNGASYNLDCFLPGLGPFPGTALSGACWSNSRTITDNTFFAVTGPGPSNVPWVEYDFTPTWTQTTHIWIRAMGGGTHSYMWRGQNPDGLDSTPSSNLPFWRKVIFWQINNGEVLIQNDNDNATVQWRSDFHPNRAVPESWRWIKLGTTSTVSGTQSTLKLYQGSAAYMIDKVIFSNDPNGVTGSPPPAMRRTLIGTTVITDGRQAVGPPASYGSATREACNVCNPAYGYTVDPSQCTCKLQANDDANSGYGSGSYCSNVPTPTNQLQAQLQTGLYAGLQPLRSTQTALKTFVQQFDPDHDQLGLVAYNTTTLNTVNNRAKLQCLRSMASPPADAASCYAQVLAALERQWPNGGNNTAEGLREGLEELGVSVNGNTGVDSTCTGVANDKHACDRGGAAKRVLILVTDGNPNVSASVGSSCTIEDYWDGLIGADNNNFECAMWYAQQAAAKGVTLYTVGLGGGANADFLTTMASGVDPRGGGTPVTMFNAQCGQYFSAARPTDLDAAFAEILTQVRDCQTTASSLLLTTSATPDPVEAGGILTYTINAANFNTANTTGVILTDTLDSNVSFVSASDGGTHQAGVVTWTVGTIAKGTVTSRTLVVSVTDVASGTILNNLVNARSVDGDHADHALTTTVVSPAPEPEVEQIWALNYSITSDQNLPVHLEHHLSQAGPYDIYLDAYKICSGVNTSAQNEGDFDCLVSMAVPAGLYDLFSTQQGQSPIRLATALQQVQVSATSTPTLVIEGGYIWAPTSTITLTLVAHEAADQPFKLYFNYGQASSRTITANISASPGPILWKVPAVGALCPNGGTPCIIESRRVSVPGQTYAATNLFITQPKIVIPSGPGPYTANETVFIYLEDHTPGLRYDLKLTGPAGSTYLGRTNLTNAQGNTPGPVAWVIPLDSTNGLYTLTSHPATDPPDLSDNTQVAILANIVLDSPTVYLPFILK